MIRFGSVVVDAATREVRVEGELQHLEPQAFDILWLLATQGDRVVRKAEILEAVWGEQIVSESALTTRIKEIRRAVGDDGRAQRVIKSVRGTGYRFVAQLDDGPRPGPSSSPASSPPLARLRLSPKTVERRPGQRIAYATVGAGPPLLFMPGWLSSLDAFADGTDPRAQLISRLAQDFSVTLFDRYGTGLSTAAGVDPQFADSVDEIRAVLAVIEGGPVTIFASSSAGPSALVAAAGNRKVARIVLMCTYANGPALFRNEDARNALLELVEQSWGMGSRVLADMIVPGIDAVTRSVFARFQRRTATAEVAAAYMRQLYEADATPSLPSIEQPCLIMHYRDDPAIPFAGSHQLAIGIRDAELMPFEGPYHTPPHEHVEQVATNVIRFVNGE